MKSKEDGLRGKSIVKAVPEIVTFGFVLAAIEIVLMVPAVNTIFSITDIAGILLPHIGNMLTTHVLLLIVILINTPIATVVMYFGLKVALKKAV